MLNVAVIQISASIGNISNLLFIKNTFATRVIGAILITAGFAIFFGTANRNVNDNNGESDKLVPKTNAYGFDASSLQFKEYTFTADRLPAFRTYRIKIVMTSNSQVYVPRMRDLRVVALA